MKHQSLKLKNTGSLVNYMMGNNRTLPVVGAGATILSHTDRSAAEVLEISNNGKTVLLEGYNAIRTDNNGMSEDQDYRYELNGNQFTIVWRNGAWRRQCEQIWFTDAALEMSYKERSELCFDLETNQAKLIEGLTFVKKSYPVINILFGVKQAYHDYSF